MKKLLFVIALTGTVCLAACGTGADNKAEQQKATNDSIAAAHHTDSLMMAQKQQHTQDSIKAAQAKAADTAKKAQ
ncbi:MAG: hypothetical protein HKL88_03405 [Bacteroidia bacterium]|jgi:hypothetical protein|nr:hypothetical protein [Bacteroidia bacterium]